MNIKISLEKRKNKELKNINKLKLKSKDNYLSKGKIKKKIQNSQIFINIK